jgi:very-short-patch-repair endonuclease
MAMLKKPAKTVRRARRLRRALSLPEVLLWRELRARPGGIKFRRQHPAGAFVLDFYRAEARLCVEVDGEAHDRGEGPERDARRDAMLAAHGIVTLRIPARDVLADMAAVVAGIVVAVEARLPLHHPAGGPPPQA